VGVAGIASVAVTFESGLDGRWVSRQRPPPHREIAAGGSSRPPACQV